EGSAASTAEKESDEESIDEVESIPDTELARSLSTSSIPIPVSPERSLTRICSPNSCTAFARSAYFSRSSFGRSRVIVLASNSLWVSVVCAPQKTRDCRRFLRSSVMSMTQIFFATPYLRISIVQSSTPWKRLRLMGSCWRTSAAPRRSCRNESVDLVRRFQIHFDCCVCLPWCSAVSQPESSQRDTPGRSWVCAILNTWKSWHRGSWPRVCRCALPRKQLSSS